MHLFNSAALLSIAIRNSGGEVLGAEIDFGTVWWFVYAGVSCVLVLFAGIMSGLTLGLMSLGLVELEILQRSGTPTEKNQAAAILPVVQKQHQLLVTLLLCNAAAMEALPIYLDKLFNHQEAGKGGELTHDETTIISGALDLTEKTAEEAMTPIESTFSLDVNSKLDWEAMGKILARGHSRVPVYSGNPRNIIGLLLVKSLLTVRAETETPVSAVSIRRIPRVPADMPLYDILNEFQKGSSHMAAVVKAKGNKRPPAIKEKSEENEVTSENLDLNTPLLSKKEDKVDNVVVDIERVTNLPRPPSKNNVVSTDASANGLAPPSDDSEDGEVIGIITLEDVFEELLQEEIVDETDEYVDVHKRIRVAAAAAASSVARAPSIRRLTALKGAGGPQKQAQTPKKSGDNSSSSVRLQNPVEPATGNKR